MRGEFLDVAGSRLYYYAAGTRGAGEPVVLLHGFPTSGHLWSDVVAALPAGHRVVVLDLLGYGRSDPASSASADINAHADRLVAVLDQLGVERACLVGHGVGGGVAQSAAIRFPHRVSRMCLVASVAFDHWPTRRGRLARAVAGVGRWLPAAWTLGALRALLARGYADADRGAHDLDLFLRPFATASGCVALMHHLVAVTSAASASLAPRVREITTPTAVVWGADDPFLPVAYGRALSETILGSTFDVVGGVRHFVPREAGHGVAATVATLLQR